jgi:very-short-patch-repair endonuclease
MKQYEQGLYSDEQQAENLLWNGALRGGRMNGYRFRRRYAVGDSSVDFICLKLRLIIEIGGPSALLKSMADGLRKEELERMGYQVLSFSEEQVVGSFSEVVEKISHKVTWLKKNTILTMQKRRK